VENLFFFTFSPNLPSSPMVGSIICARKANTGVSGFLKKITVAQLQQNHKTRCKYATHKSFLWGIAGWGKMEWWQSRPSPETGLPIHFRRFSGLL
jgi:hypothetical protein